MTRRKIKPGTIGADVDLHVERSTWPRATPDRTGCRRVGAACPLSAPGSAIGSSGQQRGNLGTQPVGHRRITVACCNFRVSFRVRENDHSELTGRPSVGKLAIFGSFASSHTRSVFLP
jgi:hypothetical protein